LTQTSRRSCVGRAGIVCARMYSTIWRRRARQRPA
jgi:hypothetical protein